MSDRIGREAMLAWLLRDDLPGGRSCAAALEWLDTTPDASIAACPRGEWLLWVAERLRYDRGRLDDAVRPAALRALRVYAPSALVEAGLMTHAREMRGISDGCGMREAEWLARSAWSAALAARAAWDAVARHDAGDLVAAVMSHVHASRAAQAAGAALAAALVAAASATAAHQVAGASLVAARVANAAREGGCSAVAEHARCANEVRRALPDLAQRLRADVGGGR